MWRKQVHIRDGVITKAIEQTNRGEILEAVAQVRNEQLIEDRPGLGRWALSVPLEDWAKLVLKYPDLRARDAAISSRAWERFIQSDESKPFRMRGRI